MPPSRVFLQMFLRLLFQTRYDQTIQSASACPSTRPVLSIPTHLPLLGTADCGFGLATLGASYIRSSEAPQRRMQSPVGDVRRHRSSQVPLHLIPAHSTTLTHPCVAPLLSASKLLLSFLVVHFPRPALQDGNRPVSHLRLVGAVLSLLGSDPVEIISRHHLVTSLLLVAGHHGA